MGKRRHDRSAAARAWITGLVVAVLAVGAVALTVTALRPAPAPTGVAEYTPLPQPTAQYRPVVAFFGDSYSAGTGATKPSNRWTSIVSADLGWRENNFALGGTGYVAEATPGSCGAEVCPAYLEAISALAEKPIKPEIVIISGGRNDGAVLPTLGERVRATIATASSQWPDAKVVVTSPLWDDNNPPSWLPDAINIVREAATSANAAFLDLGYPLLGRPDYVIDDGVHPNDAGHRAIAEAFESAWASRA